MGIGGFAGHAHKSFPRSHIGYFARLIIDQNVSAVTGACLMIKAKTWQELGGLDENLKIALNDIDLCLRVRQTGKLIVFTPFVELYHFESKSRGYENTPQKARRLESEVEYFRKRWKEF